MDKKTFEELKSMTTEELIRYTMEMQDKLNESETMSNLNYDRWIGTSKKLEAFRDAVKSVAILID